MTVVSCAELPILVSEILCRFKHPFPLSCFIGRIYNFDNGMYVCSSHQGQQCACFNLLLLLLDLLSFMRVTLNFFDFSCDVVPFMLCWCKYFIGKLPETVSYSYSSNMTICWKWKAILGKLDSNTIPRVIWSIFFFFFAPIEYLYSLKKLWFSLI